MVKKYGMNLFMTTNVELQDYIRQVMLQVEGKYFIFESCPECETYFWQFGARIAI
jgi:hypothetical protein